MAPSTWPCEWAPEICPFSPSGPAPSCPNAPNELSGADPPGTRARWDVRLPVSGVEMDAIPRVSQNTGRYQNAVPQRFENVNSYKPV